jgi:hypothetical protein
MRASCTHVVTRVSAGAGHRPGSQLRDGKACPPRTNIAPSRRRLLLAHKRDLQVPHPNPHPLAPFPRPKPYVPPAFRNPMKFGYFLNDGGI